MMLAIPHRSAPPLAFCHMLTAKGKAAPTWRPPFQNADVKLPTDLPINGLSCAWFPPKGWLLSSYDAGQSVAMFLTASFPVRRSCSVSKVTFWPSPKLRIPALSKAVTWINTSLPPPSGEMKP
jgi:hypothetical protein